MISTETTDCLTAALEYADRGFALVPVGLDKKPHHSLLPKDSRGKPVWKPYAVNPAKEAEVRKWFKQDPYCNIGIITGQASNGIVVADFDSCLPNELHMPPTPRVMTKKGFHAYFRSNSLIKCHKLPWGDLKGEGGYCVLPPSRHSSGHIYYWAELLSLNDVDIAECPEWVYSSKISAPRLNRKKEASREYSLLASPIVDPGYKGLGLGAWDRNETFVLAASKILGIPREATKNIGKAFHCILPGHKDTHPSASLFRRKDGLVVYHDWHGASGEEWYYLAEVRASLSYRQAVKLKAPELAVWHLRMLVETGLVSPVIIDAQFLPNSLSLSARKVYDGFLFLLGCKWLHTYGEPTAFSWRFAATWCGVGERQAGEAMHDLLKIGLIREAGKECKLTTFLPGRDVRQDS